MITYFNTILFIEVWCNGNTEDFGSSISGSNPDTSTTIILIDNVFIVYDEIIIFCGRDRQS